MLFCVCGICEHLFVKIYECYKCIRILYTSRYPVQLHQIVTNELTFIRQNTIYIYTHTHILLMFLPYYSFPQKQLIDIHNMREDMTNILIVS